jgi:hypothetical protein
MLIFRPIKEDQEEKDNIVYRDYSLMKRLPTLEATALSAVDQLNKKKKKNEWEMQRLQSLEINYEHLLSGFEWTSMAEIVNHVSGLAWF